MSHDAQIDVVGGCLRVDHRLRREADPWNDVALPPEEFQPGPSVEPGRLVDPLDDLVEDRALGLHVAGRRHEHADQANDLAPKWHRQPPAIGAETRGDVRLAPTSPRGMDR
jgi:hypothetical protein